MVCFVPVARLNQYVFFLIIILFFFCPLLIIVYQQYSVPYQYVYSNPSNGTRYEQYCREVDQRINTEQISTNSIQLDPRKESIPYSYSQWHSTPLMPRLLTPCEHAIYMNLLSILIERVFKKYKIEYMMMAATLLGSYTRHDLLPWDDDIDIRVSISDRYNLQAIIVGELSAEPYSIILLQMHNERNYDKVFFSWCPRTSKVPWRFPFIDIFYHDQNSTHVWLLGQPSSCPVRRENVFPLVLRPLGTLWLYGPREPMAHFESRMMTQIETGCYSFPYSHKYERLMRPDILYADCSQLKSVYPYVERECTSYNCKEHLKLVQQTLNVLCYQFPLVSILNNSDFQCARLRTNQEIPTSAFNLNRPTQITLFIIIDQSSSNISPIDISLDFSQSLYSPSIINEIDVALLVTGSNFTINNQNTTVYTPYDIPLLRWQNSIENTYDLIDLLQLENQIYENDQSLCKWNSNIWDRLFNSNMSSNVSYAYFLKTTTLQLQFTLIDTSHKLSLSLLPSPYLYILYCIPYKLGITELIIIICFGVLFIASVTLLGILHYFKGGDDNRPRNFDRYHYHHHHHHGPPHNIFLRNHSKTVRHQSSASMSSVE